MKRTPARGSAVVVTRDELVTVLQAAEQTSKGQARSLAEIAARVTIHRARRDQTARAHHVKALMGQLAVEGVVRHARGGAVRSWARVPPDMSHNTDYYVWGESAEAYRLKYQDLLRRRTLTEETSSRLQELFGADAVVRPAGTMVWLELPVENALDLLATLTPAE